VVAVNGSILYIGVILRHKTVFVDRTAIPEITRAHSFNLSTIVVILRVVVDANTILCKSTIIWDETTR
jgi:hypothetical protein